MYKYKHAHMHTHTHTHTHTFWRHEEALLKSFCGIEAHGHGDLIHLNKWLGTHWKRALLQICDLKGLVYQNLQFLIHSQKINFMLLVKSHVDIT